MKRKQEQNPAKFEPEEKEELLNEIVENEGDSTDSEGDLEDSDGEDSELEGGSSESDEEHSGSDEEDSLSGSDASDGKSLEDGELSDEDKEDESDEDQQSSSSNQESDSDSAVDDDTGELPIPGKKPSNLSNKNQFDKQKTKVKVKEKGMKPKLTEHKNKVFNESELKNDKVQEKVNEYDEHDTSDEEDIRNTVGNVPKNWYDDYKHLGYDWDGKPIAKLATGDSIDGFLKRIEDPDFWRTVKDPQTGQDVVLCDDDINLIKRIHGQRIPDGDFDEYAPWIEWFTSEVMEMPVRKFPEHKRSFLPSRSEAKKVSKLVHALKMGWIKTREEEERLRAKREPQFYMLWTTDDHAEEMRRIHKHIAAPKRTLPGHAESYNPPQEYLFDEREMKKWNKQKSNPIERKLHFVPQRYDSLRKVPAYSRYIKERFLRCLDLYLCPRAIKMKLTIEPEALVPKLPSPKDLQPFPTVLAIEYKGHTDMVRCITVDRTGQYLASGSDDTTVKIWEVNTGRCLKTINTDGIVRSIEWCPNGSISLILIASNNRVLLINPHVGDPLICSKTDTILNEFPGSSTDVLQSDRVRTSVQWVYDDIPQSDRDSGHRVVLKHFKEVSQVAWHGKGDYFATVMPEGQNRSVLISQLSKRRSQLPFSKSKGLVQSVLFHPVRPLLFVATQKHVRVYDLVKQQLVKRLMTNSRWVSTMDVHPGGDNLLVATYDRKILWFDLDLSTKPYQTLRLHGTAVRGVAFHKRYPLFASGSDDRSLIVSHGMVYNDLLKNPLIVPLKRFQDHAQYNDFGIFAVKFHPLQPWVFTSGADATVKMYTN